MRALGKAVAITIIMLCMTCFAANQKQWLVVEDPPASSVDDAYSEFPRLLLMQISKAGLFRCVDRATYRTQAKELALGDGGDAEFSSAGYCISWVVRSRATARGNILTVSLGYNDIGKSGNNELLQSEDVMVYEWKLNGEDLLTAAARKSARAILFRLMPPQVIEVVKLKSGKTKVVVDCGKDFLSEGDRIKFVRIKTSPRGVKVSSQVGTGVVRSTRSDVSDIQLQGGVAVENDSIEIIDRDTPSDLSLCPVCDGKKKLRIDVKCDGCNGQGKLWHIRGRRRTLQPCQECHGKGTRSMDKICDECGGSGKSTYTKGINRRR